MGVYRAIGDLGFLFGPVALGWVADTSGYPAALVAVAILLAATVVPFAFFAGSTPIRQSTAQEPLLFVPEAQEVDAVPRGSS